MNSNASTKSINEFYGIDINQVLVRGWSDMNPGEDFLVCVSYKPKAGWLPVVVVVDLSTTRWEYTDRNGGWTDAPVKKMVLSHYDLWKELPEFSEFWKEYYESV